MIRGNMSALAELVSWAGDLWQFRRGRRAGRWLRTAAAWHMSPKNKIGNWKPGEIRSSKELRETGGQAMGLGGWTARQILEAAAALA